MPLRGAWMPETLTVSLKEHFETIIRLNDQRYKEVNIEREKALKIKEEADRRALELAREIQAFRDEKANGLLDLVKSERGGYATNKDIEPLKAYIAGQTARGVGMNTIFVGGMALFMAGIALANYLKP
jgi:hypothetical protein